jgi:hypothetical protein
MTRNYIAESMDFAKKKIVCPSTFSSSPHRSPAPTGQGIRLIEIQARPNRPLALENLDFSCLPLFEKV